MAKCGFWAGGYGESDVEKATPKRFELAISEKMRMLEYMGTATSRPLASAGVGWGGESTSFPVGELESPTTFDEELRQALCLFRRDLLRSS